jgi:hypothetical protein
MAFNSYTYHANKYAEMSREALAKARQYRAEQRHPDYIRSQAKLAVLYARCSRSQRRLREMQIEARSH